VPLALTIYIISITFLFINDLTNEWTKFLFGLEMPGMGVVITFCIISIAGMLGGTYISSQIMSLVNKTISKIPVISSVYSAIKDVLSAFVGKGKKFTNPVRFKVSKDSELQLLGFITQYDLSKLGVEGNKVSIYMPDAYAMMGNVIIVPQEYVTPLTCSSSEAMKFILSGGLTDIIEKDKEK
jgi:Uncharacterized conserved protein